MIRVNNRLCKKAEEREMLWEQRQEQRCSKKTRPSIFEFENPSSTHPHLNLPEFHSPASSITRQDSEDDVSDISHLIEKETAKANNAKIATTVGNWSQWGQLL